MVNYKNGKIYKIVNDVNDDIYIGSTCQSLSMRMAGHRRLCKFKIKNNSNRRVYVQMNEIGITHYSICLIEKYPCESKEELHKKEGFYIKKLGASLNTHVAGRTREEYALENREHILKVKKEGNKIWNANNPDYYHKYYQDNKEKKSKQSAEYFKKNQKKITEYKKKYNEDNKEHQKEYFKKRYEQNKEQIQKRRKEKITCECGSITVRAAVSVHKKSKKHIEFMNNKHII